MSSAFYWMLILGLFFAIAQAMRSHTEQPRCLRCGGKGQHKDDCPWRDE